MAKINIFVLLLLFTSIFTQSCNEKRTIYSFNSFTNDKYNMVISGSGVPIEFYFKEGIIRINFPDKEWNNSISIVLSETEKNNITDLLFNLDLLKPNGEAYIIGKNTVMPPNNDLITIFKNQKIISVFHVSRNYESEDFFPSNSEKNVVKFRDFLVDFLSKKNEFILLEQKRKKGSY